MSDYTLPVFCGNCGQTGEVRPNQVTASASPLQCPKCASTDIGLVGVDPRPSKVVASRSHAVAGPPGRGTGWTGPDQRRYDGTSSYVGPTPQNYPRSAPVAPEPITCPECEGSKYDLIDKGPCRLCHGTGTYTPPTARPGAQELDATTNAQPAGGAGWHGAARRTADMSRRLYAEHPSGYRAEWTGGNRFHVFEGDHPVDSPPIPGYGDHLSSSESEKVRDKFQQKHLEKGLNDWARDNGAEYMDFNHPTDRPSYGDRHGYTGARTAGRPSTDPMGSVEEHIRSSTPHYPGNDPERFTDQSDHVRNWTPAPAPSGPYQMDQASCPNCSHAPTQLLKDKNEDAWWHCPNCGPLANIDKNPEVNPYSPGEGFQPDRTMKTGGFLSRNKKTGRLMKILAALHETNELHPIEAMSIGRRTLQRYPEGR